MKKAFILCDTPYQIMNGLNIILNLQDDIVFDLYIINQFETACTVYNNIELSDRLNNVILIKRTRNKLLSHIKDYTDYLLPESVYRNLIIKSKKKATDFKYDIIFASVYTREACVMSYLNNKADFYLFDDGNGSYSGRITLDTINPIKMKLYRLFHIGPPMIKLQRLYVNNAKMCNSKMTQNIIQLPRITEDYIKYLYSVFGEQNDRFDKRIVWLTTPNELCYDISSLDNKIMDCLKEFYSDVCIRLHPRQQDSERFCGFSIDNNNRLWELSISDSSINNKILIGLFSSAQTNPKYLFDNEPYLIFLFPFYASCIHNSLIERMNQSIELLKEVYSDPSKIRTAKDIDELRSIILEWIQ